METVDCVFSVGHYRSYLHHTVDPKFLFISLHRQFTPRKPRRELPMRKDRTEISGGLCYDGGFGARQRSKDHAANSSHTGWHGLDSPTSLVTSLERTSTHTHLLLGKWYSTESLFIENFW
jgi:hypothetical protein